MRLLLEKIKLAIQKRTKTAPQKSYAAWAAKGYDDAPEVSVVIQSHDKSLQVCHILPKLRRHQHVEIIVIDDGSALEHTQRIAKALTGANEFLLRANDLYENRTYDRAIRMAHGRYIALLQDDDDFSDDGVWIDEALGYFAKYPRLAIIGGNWGLRLEFDDARQWGHGMRDETLRSGEFRFVPSVNRAPMWIRRDLFDEHLHQIDPSFAPFQYDDDELCLRAWLCGLQVGWYDARFRSLSAGGMRLWNKGFTGEQSQRNGRRLYQMYAHRMDEILTKVRASNG